VAGIPAHELAVDDLMETIAAQSVINGPAPLSANPDHGPFVYYIQCGAFLKIGTSINPESRCDQLRRGGKAQRPTIWVGEPRLIAYVPGNVSHERALHKKFNHLRDQGEWFMLDHDLAEHVNDEQLTQCLIETVNHEADHKQYTAEPIDRAAAYQMALSSKNRLDEDWIGTLDS